MKEEHPPTRPSQLRDHGTAPAVGELDPMTKKVGTLLTAPQKKKQAALEKWSSDKGVWGPH